LYTSFLMGALGSKEDGSPALPNPDCILRSVNPSPKS
jgi:hypothetical protein